MVIPIPSVWEEVLEGIRGEMHDAEPAVLGIAIGQGEKPPLYLQPGSASAGRVLRSLEAEEPRASKREVQLEGGTGRNGTACCSHGQAEGKDGEQHGQDCGSHTARAPQQPDSRSRGQRCIGTKSSTSTKMQVAEVSLNTA